MPTTNNIKKTYSNRYCDKPLLIMPTCHNVCFEHTFKTPIMRNYLTIALIALTMTNTVAANETVVKSGYYQRNSSENIAEGLTTYSKTTNNAINDFETAASKKAMVLTDEQNATNKKNANNTGYVAEDGGTIFCDITLEEALEKAKAEGKYVLINFHTATCAPCRKMEKVVFPQPQCGEYINKHFVSIMINGEDDGIGTEWAKKYNIFIYPTYLILSSEYFKVGEILGAEFDVNKFLDMIKAIVQQAEKK